MSRIHGLGDLDRNRNNNPSNNNIGSQGNFRGNRQDPNEMDALSV
jgi:hypothetical protein